MRLYEEEAFLLVLTPAPPIPSCVCRCMRPRGFLVGFLIGFQSLCSKLPVCMCSYVALLLCCYMWMQVMTRLSCLICGRLCSSPSGTEHAIVTPPEYRMHGANAGTFLMSCREDLFHGRAVDNSTLPTGAVSAHGLDAKWLRKSRRSTLIDA